jgi:hypothetical protein
MKQDIHTIVVECDTCQCNKGETVKPPSTLQPLLIPPTIWMDISIDFIVGLPKSGNKSVLMVVVGHLSKYSHLCSLQHPLTTSTVAQSFMDNIFNSMDFLILLFMTVIPFLPTIFGNNYSGSRELNYISSQPIIPRVKDKLKQSTSVRKHVLGVLCLTNNISWFSGYP